LMFYPAIESTEEKQACLGKWWRGDPTICQIRGGGKKREATPKKSQKDQKELTTEETVKEITGRVERSKKG